jgi:hypothetical protein
VLGPEKRDRKKRKRYRHGKEKKNVEASIIQQMHRNIGNTGGRRNKY